MATVPWGQSVAESFVEDRKALRFKPPTPRPPPSPGPAPVATPAPRPAPAPKPAPVPTPTSRAPAQREDKGRSIFDRIMEGVGAGREVTAPMRALTAPINRRLRSALLEIARRAGVPFQALAEAGTATAIDWPSRLQQGLPGPLRPIRPGWGTPEARERAAQTRSDLAGLLVASRSERLQRVRDMVQRQEERPFGQQVAGSVFDPFIARSIVGKVGPRLIRGLTSPRTRLAPKVGRVPTPPVTLARAAVPTTPPAVAPRPTLALPPGRQAARPGAATAVRAADVVAPVPKIHLLRTAVETKKGWGADVQSVAKTDERLGSLSGEYLAGTELSWKVAEKADLPDILYHVTTNPEAIEVSRLIFAMTPERAAMQGVGLGGRARSTVSLTANRETAETIRRELGRLGEVARTDPDNMAELVTRIAKQDETISGLAEGSITKSTEFTAVIDEFALRKRVGTPDMRLRSKELYDRYLSARESIGYNLAKAKQVDPERFVPNLVGDTYPSLQNPIFFGIDDAAAARITSENVRILEVSKASIPDEAFIRRQDFLDEVEVFADIPTTARPAEALPTPGLYRGQFRGGGGGQRFIDPAGEAAPARVGGGAVLDEMILDGQKLSKYMYRTDRGKGVISGKAYNIDELNNVRRALRSEKRFQAEAPGRRAEWKKVGLDPADYPSSMSKSMLPTLKGSFDVSIGKVRDADYFPSIWATEAGLSNTAPRYVSDALWLYEAKRVGLDPNDLIRKYPDSFPTTAARVADVPAARAAEALPTPARAAGAVPAAPGVPAGVTGAVTPEALAMRIAEEASPPRRPPDAGRPPPTGGLPPPRPPGAPSPREGVGIMEDLGQPEQILALATRPDAWRTLVNLKGVRSVVGKVNPAGVAQTPRQLWTVGRGILGVQSKQLSGTAMLPLEALGSQQRVFGKVGKDGKLASGPLVGLTVNTIRTYPRRYASKTTAAQKEWIRVADDIEKAKLQFLKDNGIKIKELSFEEGGQFAGRRVYARYSSDGDVMDVLTVSAGPSRPGAKLTSQQQRVFKTAEEAVEAGYRYLPDDEALRLNVWAAYNKVAEQRMADWLLMQVDHRTRDVPDAIRLARQSARQRLQRGRMLLAAINRAVLGKPVPAATIQSIARAHPEEAQALKDLILALQRQNPQTASEVQRLTDQANFLITDSAVRFSSASDDAAKAAKAAFEIGAFEGELHAPAFKKAILTGVDAKDIANSINKEIAATVPGWVNRVNQGQAVSRFLMLGGDVSPLTIQLLFLAGYSPRIYGKAMKGMVEAIADPMFHVQYLAQPENIAILKKYKTLISTRSGGTELTESLGRGGLLDTPVGKVVGLPIKPFQRGFEGALDVAGIEMAKSLDHMAKNAGDIEDIAAFVNEFRGLASSQLLGVSATQRQYEALQYLAPRYFRAIGSLMFDVTRGGIRGRLARKAMARGIAALTITAIVFSHLRGESPKEILEHLTPGHRKFFTWEIGGQMMGPGSKVRSVLMLFGRSAKDPSSLQERNRQNPLVKFGRGQLSPGVGFAMDILTTRNAIGDKTTDTWRKTAETIYRNFIPLSIDTALFEGGNPQERATRFAGEFVGLRTYPVNVQWKLGAEWRSDFDTYYTISTDPEVRQEARHPSRLQYRKTHPEIDAKLFIVGRVRSLRSGAALSYALRLIREEKVMSYHISPKLLKDYEKVLGKSRVDLLRGDAKPIERERGQPLQPAATGRSPNGTGRQAPSVSRVMAATPTPRPVMAPTPTPRRVSAPTPTPQPPPDRSIPIASRWLKVRDQIDTRLKDALISFWFEGKKLSPAKRALLRNVHQTNSFGERNFDVWLKQTLRQAQEAHGVAIGQAR